MIVVQTDLLCHGFSDHPRNESLGKMTIVNDGTGTSSKGNYNVKVYSRGKSPRVVRSGRVDNWPRNSKSAMHLIAKCFSVLYPEYNSDCPETSTQNDKATDNPNRGG